MPACSGGAVSVAMHVAYVITYVRMLPSPTSPGTPVSFHAPPCFARYTAVEWPFAVSVAVAVSP